MTLQQLEYIVAVDKYRHFVKAAEASGVTQSTLSSMIQKLENELDVQIFNRGAHPVEPTRIGMQIIAQARVTLFNAEQVKKLVINEKGQQKGELKLGIIPTVAPYILPKLINALSWKYPELSVTILEARTDVIIEKMKKADLDMALLATPLNNEQLLEVPIYYEKFVAYISPSEDIYAQAQLESHQILSKHLWLLQEGHCLRSQVLNICDNRSSYSAIYEAGSIDTLVKIVDENGGYTIIPELHVPLLSEGQKKNIRPIAAPEPVREVSLIVRQDFVRERILNMVADEVKGIIPESMIDGRLKKFAIKL